MCKRKLNFIHCGNWNGNDPDDPGCLGMFRCIELRAACSRYREWEYARRREGIDPGAALQQLGRPCNPPAEGLVVEDVRWDTTFCASCERERQRRRAEEEAERIRPRWTEEDNEKLQEELKHWV